MAYITNWNPPRIYERTATFEWDVEHAALVHEGAISDSNIYPARPWTDYAESQIDSELEFKASWDETEDLQESFNALVQTFDGEFKLAISDDIWNWPRETFRQSGEYVPPGLRNIIDQGDLLRSQKYTMSHQGVSDAT